MKRSKEIKHIIFECPGTHIMRLSYTPGLVSYCGGKHGIEIEHWDTDQELWKGGVLPFEKFDKIIDFLRRARKECLKRP